MNKIIEVLKKAIGSEKEEVANFIPFVEGEKVASQPEETLSKFKICLNEIETILDKEGLTKEDLIGKICELEEIHNKKVKSLKEVMKEQTIFYRIQRDDVKLKLKEKGVKITNLEAEVRTLNDAISIFGKLEKKYSEAIKEIERLNKLNESQRNIILKSSYKS